MRFDSTNRRSLAIVATIATFPYSDAFSSYSSYLHSCTPSLPLTASSHSSRAGAGEPLFMQPNPGGKVTLTNSASTSAGPSSTSTIKGSKRKSSNSQKERNGSTRSDLSAWTSQAAASASYAETESFATRSSWTTIPDASFGEEFLLPVISTALLITSNTVGASMLVLPELATGPGMAISASVLVAAYLWNWMSGLCIAQVAIQQYEDSGEEVPSSFKEFARANLWESASTVVSVISIFVNSLVLAFDTTKAGQVMEQILITMTGAYSPVTFGAGSAAAVATVVWAALMLGIVSTQSLARLSQVASLLVGGVFISFAGLLLPGLAQVTDPLAVLTSGPLDPQVSVTSSILHMAPVFVTTLVFQNIVPTVTRILNYDRLKVVSAITMGSIMPLLIYMAWCVAVLGGGIPSGTDAVATATTSSLNSMSLFTLFSMVTVAGSSIGTLMSLAEEFEILLRSSATATSSSVFNDDETAAINVKDTTTAGTTSTTKQDTFSLPSVAVPTIIALGVSQIFADDISGALKVAGSFGSPLLYGLIPVSMAYLQQQRKKQPQQLQQQQQQWSLLFRQETKQSPSAPTILLPGGMAGLGTLGLGATALVGSELAETISKTLLATATA